MEMRNFILIKDFFDSLDKKLQYPNCEGNADKLRIMEQQKKVFELSIKDMLK